MAFRLTPRDSAFYNMFADAGRNVAAAADLLAGLMDPNAVRATIAKDLRECEHVGDTATHRILRQLNTSFVTPFDREDIYRLAAALDDVVDAMEAAADFVVLTGSARCRCSWAIRSTCCAAPRRRPPRR